MSRADLTFTGRHLRMFGKGRGNKKYTRSLMAREFDSAVVFSLKRFKLLPSGWFYCVVVDIFLALNCFASLGGNSRQLLGKERREAVYLALPCFLGPKLNFSNTEFSVVCTISLHAACPGVIWGFSLCSRTGPACRRAPQ